MTQECGSHRLSNETLLAVIQERLDGFMREVRDTSASTKLELSQINFTVKELEKRERERNDKLRILDNKHDINELKWAEHAALSVTTLKDVTMLKKAYDEGLTRHKVYSQWWVWVALGGAAMGGIVQGLNYLGVF